MSSADARRAAARALFALFLIAGSVAAWWMSQPSQRAEPFGWQPDPEGAARFLGELPEPYFAQAAPEAMRRAKPIDTFLYRAMDRAHRARYGKPFVVGRQGIGDCVSWGAAHAVYCAEAVDWDLGKLAEPPKVPSTEAIYGGSRVEARGRAEGSGGWSDGSTGFGAAKWLRDWGVVYRQPFPDLGYDLTTYSADRAKQWGNWGAGGQGDRGRLDAIAKKHPCKHVVQVRTWDELVAAIESGFPVTIASSVGFNSGPRDSDAFCAASGTWMHQMAIVGVRFAANGSPRDGALIMNSWGNYVGGGKWPDDMPDGCFWASRETVQRILSQNDSWAIGSVDGFGWRDIHHDGWLDAGVIPTLSRFP